MGSCLEVSSQGVSTGLDVEMAEALFAKNRTLLLVIAELTMLSVLPSSVLDGLRHIFHNCGSSPGLEPV